jgi:hypothetical protein
MGWFGVCPNMPAMLLGITTLINLSIKMEVKVMKKIFVSVILIILISVLSFTLFDIYNKRSTNDKTQTSITNEALANQVNSVETQQDINIVEVDSVVKLNRYNTFYYVQGIVKNIGQNTAYWVKIKVRSVDKNGKLISLDETYADPDTIKPGQESTYEIMVEYDENIDDFQKEVQWSIAKY